MQLNTPRRVPPVVTHGGSKAYAHATPIQELRRTVLACMLWEDQFYEGGQSVADRIAELVRKIVQTGHNKNVAGTAAVNALAIEARSEFNLRHVPLLLCAELAKNGALQAATLAKVIQRADELSEFLTIYWRAGKTPIANQVKKGLAQAFQKFDAYQLAKYDREKAIRLRDVLFLVHAKPKDEVQAAIWKQLVDGTLPTPDTWETALSGGADKREHFERQLREGTLGYLALLRNLRGMMEAGVDRDLVVSALHARKGGAERVFPFRYVAAARACPQLEPAIDSALCEAISATPALSGKTTILVDVSPSMDAKLSAKSDLSRMDAACALASLIHGDVRMFSFSNLVVEVPPRRGMAGVDALIKSQPHNGTRLFDAIRFVNERVPSDRLIVITDEQDYGSQLKTCPDPAAPRGYMINVASYQNGVGYGRWTHIDGFSEGIIRWMYELEKEVQAKAEVAA